MSQPGLDSNFQFRWIPGTPQNAGALARLKQAFPRPQEPMGEAWFMSKERKYYRDLCEKNLHDLDCLEVSDALREITSGITCFGELEEWRVWFHYILSQMTECAFEACAFHHWLEPLISAFMVVYPSGVKDEPYRGFLKDVFETLAVSPMQPSLWEDGDIILEKSLLYFAPGLGVWQWNEKVADEFSALLFFCLKYLPPSSVDGWVQSIIALPSVLYRAQFLLWLLATRDILFGKIDSPENFPKKNHIEIDWENSHCIALRPTGNEGSVYAKETFLPAENVAAFRLALETHLTQAMVLEWLRSFESDPMLKSEMLDMGRDKDFLNMFDPTGLFALYE
ncbi:MAG TPA: hypothetical protein VGG10_06385 [Rhizomicrobium sp.]|jgi:hypothetical protein